MFAELNQDNVCIGLRSTRPDDAAINAKGHKIVEIAEWDESLHFKIYNEVDKTWSSPPPGEIPPPSPPTINNSEIKDLLLVTMNNLATIYPDKVDSDLLAVLVKEGKRTIEEVPIAKQTEVGDKVAVK
jgi:hypothetical protein